MKTMKEYSKDAILAVLGTVDEQNEDIKDLLRRGSAILGMAQTENEELCYNGNRAEIERRRAEREAEDRRKRSVGGMEISYNKEKNFDGEGGTKRSVEFITSLPGGNDGSNGNETEADTEGDVRGDETT